MYSQNDNVLKILENLLKRNWCCFFFLESPADCKFTKKQIQHRHFTENSWYLYDIKKIFKTKKRVMKSFKHNSVLQFSNENFNIQIQNKWLNTMVQLTTSYRKINWTSFNIWNSSQIERDCGIINYVTIHCHHAYCWNQLQMYKHSWNTTI